MGRICTADLTISGITFVAGFLLVYVILRLFGGSR